MQYMPVSGERESACVAGPGRARQAGLLMNVLGVTTSERARDGVVRRATRVAPN